MRQSEPWGAIAVPIEAHSKQRGGLPPRMHDLQTNVLFWVVINLI